MEILIVFIMGCPASLFGWLITLIWKANTGYNKIIQEFKCKLPSEGKKASKLSEEEIEKSTFIPNLCKMFDCYDVSTEKFQIDEKTASEFINKLVNYNYCLCFFKSEYVKNTDNIKRVLKDLSNIATTITLDSILNDRKYTLYHIIIYKIKIIPIIIKGKRDKRKYRKFMNNLKNKSN